jgi:two-component system, cell cycle sensor histidine kinase and response regulator CckA
MAKNILVVDDERVLATTLTAILKHAGYNAIAAYNAPEAIEILRTTPIDLLISDVIMPEMNGFELATHTRRNYPHTRILLISGNAATQEMITADPESYRFELLAKPILPKQMLAHVEWLLAKAA